MAFNLEQVERSLNDLSRAVDTFTELVNSNPRISKEFVDCVCLLSTRLNSKDTLVAICDKLKGMIKSDLLTHDETVRQGHNYEAIIQVADKPYWKFAELKAFLGEQVPKFQVIRTEKSLVFRAKTGITS